jgi:deazaflavin-dependent oxidoreductase (nitroreductase family)
VATFDRATLDLAAQEREVTLSTWGRKTGKPVQTILWIWGDGNRLFIRAGGGLKADWSQNLYARGRGILTLAGQEIPVRARHVIDPAEARAGYGWIVDKYHSDVLHSTGDEPLVPGEQATFELTPEEVP